MRTRRIHIALSGCLLLASSLVAAADKEALQVELVAFAQPGADGSNYWQDTRALPPCHAVALRDGSGAEAAFNGNNDCVKEPGFDAVYTGFSATASEALPAQVSTLKTANYALLLNRNWRQANGNLAPVLLRGGKTMGDRQELQGTLTITRTDKALEATLALVLTKLAGDKPQYVTLQEKRVIVPGKINYFDHPLFGVLLKISDAP